MGLSHGSVSRVCLTGQVSVSSALYNRAVGIKQVSRPKGWIDGQKGRYWFFDEEGGWLQWQGFDRRLLYHQREETTISSTRYHTIHLFSFAVCGFVSVSEHVGVHT